MKNQTLVLVGLGALLTTTLFYQESWGVNILLFSLVVSVLQVMAKKNLFRNKAWLLVSSGTFLAGLGFNFTNSAFAAILYVMSMVASVYLHQMEEAFWPLAPFHAFLNLTLRPFEWISLIGNGMKSRAIPVPDSGNSTEEARQNKSFPFRLILIPGILFFIFIVVYSLANQGFSDMVDSLLDIINIALVLFLMGSFIAMIPLLDSRPISPLTFLASYFKEAWSLDTEFDIPKIKRLEVKQKEAIISFVGLIVILLVLLGFEVNSILNPSPEKGMADGVHESVYALICSIILAALVTIYYFSGSVFFMRKIEWVRKLAYSWIILNGVLAGIGAYKTMLYIAHFGLTYKRLAVLEYLTTIATGLVLVSICIYYKKGNWKLVNQTIAFTYTYLILFNLPNWDRVMVRANFTSFENHDPEYCQKLSISGYAGYCTIQSPNKPYNDSYKAEKAKRFQQEFASHGFLSKTFEDYRIEKDLASRGNH